MDPSVDLLLSALPAAPMLRVWLVVLRLVLLHFFFVIFSSKQI